MKPCTKRRIQLCKKFFQNLRQLFDSNYLKLIFDHGVIFGIFAWIGTFFLFITVFIADVYCMCTDGNFPHPTRMSVVDGEVTYYPDDK